MVHVVEAEVLIVGLSDCEDEVTESAIAASSGDTGSV